MGERFDGDREGAIFDGVVVVVVVVVLRFGWLQSGAALLDGVVGVGAAGCCCCCRWRRWRCFLRRRRCLDRDSPNAEVEVAAGEEAVKAGAATLEEVVIGPLREEKDKGEGDAVDDPASLTNRFGGA